MIEKNSIEVQNERGEIQPLLPAGFKRCSKCGEVKLYSQYGKDRTKKDGYYSSCKLCNKRIYIAQEKHCLDCGIKIPNYPTNILRCNKCFKIHRLNSMKEWHEKNKEHEKLYDKINKLKRIERVKKYRQTDKAIVTRLKKYVYPNEPENSLLIECHLLITKTKRLCRTSQS